jgi:hypothetical protein
MSEQTVPEAWVLMPSEAEIRTQMPPGAIPAEYDFGFLPAMGRLIATHDRIGPKLASLHMIASALSSHNYFGRLCLTQDTSVARNVR